MSQSDQIKAITEKLEEGIKDLFQSDTYKNYLDTLSRFHSYSFNNTLLIAMQKPDASLVAGYGTWKQANRYIKKGEKAIKIIAPCPYKKEVEKPVLDKDGKAIIGPDGKELTEKAEQQYLSFAVVNVFDISQTEGEPIEIAHKLDMSVDGYDDFMEALRRFSPVPIEMQPISGAANGYYDLLDKKIVIDSDMSEAMHCKTGLHEISHALLHDRDTGREKDNMPDTRTREIQAESIAYTIANYYGLNTEEYSFGYVAGWSSTKEIPELKASMTVIQETAQQMIKGIDEKLEEIRMEKGLSLSDAKEMKHEKEKKHFSRRR